MFENQTPPAFNGIPCPTPEYDDPAAKAATSYARVLTYIDSLG
jgi:hypothetical protein